MLQNAASVQGFHCLRNSGRVYTVYNRLSLVSLRKTCTLNWTFKIPCEIVPDDILKYFFREFKAWNFICAGRLKTCFFFSHLCLYEIGFLPMWELSISDDHVTKTCLYNFDPLKPHFYTKKKKNWGLQGYTLFFLFLLKNIDCGTR